MATAYADLPKTAGGAVTAAGKRLVEAERLEAEQRVARELGNRQAVEAARKVLVAASDAYDQAPGGEVATAATARELRIQAQAIAIGENMGRQAWREESEEVTVEAIADQIHRLEVLGLDGELTALEALHAVADAIAEQFRPITRITKTTDRKAP